MFVTPALQATFQTHPDTWDTNTWAQVQDFAGNFYAARAQFQQMIAIRVSSLEDFYQFALPQARACWDAAHVEVKVVEEPVSE